MRHQCHVHSGHLQMKHVPEMGLTLLNRERKQAGYLLLSEPHMAGQTLYLSCRRPSELLDLLRKTGLARGSGLGEPLHPSPLYLTRSPRYQQLSDQHEAVEFICLSYSVCALSHGVTDREMGLLILLAASSPSSWLYSIPAHATTVSPKTFLTRDSHKPLTLIFAFTETHTCSTASYPSPQLREHDAGPVSQQYLHRLVNSTPTESVRDAHSCPQISRAVLSNRPRSI